MDPPSSRKGALGDQKGPRIEDEVGSRLPSETILWAISSTRLGGGGVSGGFGWGCGGKGGNVRLEAENVADAVRLVAGLLAVGVDAAELVDKLDAGHPLVNGELDLAAEVVDVLDQGAEHLAVPWRGLGAHVVDDGLGEVGVEAVRGGGLLAIGGGAVGGGAVGGHCAVLGVVLGVRYHRHWWEKSGMVDEEWLGAGLEVLLMD